jgi:hypothetical protein
MAQNEGTAVSVTKPRVLFAWVVFGMLAGSLVPVWDQGSRYQAGKGVLLLFSLAATLVAGLLAALEVIIQGLRGRRSRFPIVPRATLWKLLPFDLGVVIGATVSIMAGVGSDPNATGVFIALGGFGMGVFFVACVAYVGRRAIKRWRDGALSWVETAIFLAFSVGFLGFGIGCLGFAVRLLNGDDRGFGVEGIVMFGGVASIMVAGVIAKVTGRRLEV